MNAACVASVRLTRMVAEPRDETKRVGSVVGETWISRSVDSPWIARGCRVAASGDEVLRPDGQEC